MYGKPPQCGWAPLEQLALLLIQASCAVIPPGIQVDLRHGTPCTFRNANTRPLVRHINGTIAISMFRNIGPAEKPPWPVVPLTLKGELQSVCVCTVHCMYVQYIQPHHTIYLDIKPSEHYPISFHRRVLQQLSEWFSPKRSEADLCLVEFPGALTNLASKIHFECSVP